MSTTARLTSVAMTIGLSACGGGTSSVAPSASVVSSNATTLVGYVANGIVGPIGGALVTVTTGASTGATAVTGSDGYFRLAYAYSSNGQLQVTKAGYAPATTPSVAAPPGGAIFISLHSATPPVDLGGVYEVIFGADATCTQIPEIMRTRSYPAVIQQAPQFPQNTNLDVTLSGGSFAAAQQGIAGALNSFFGFVEANSVDFRILNRYETSEIDEGIREEIGPNMVLEIQGEAKATVNDASTIVAPMSGSFTVTDATGTRTCTSSNHVFTLRRRS